MFIRRLLYFIFGLAISGISLFFFAYQGYNIADSALPITPYAVNTDTHFVHVDHDSIIQRNRFSQPLGVSVRRSFILGDTDTLPLGVLNDFEMPNRSPLRISLPEFVHVNVNENYVGRIEIPTLGISDAVYFTGDDFFLRRDWRGRSNNAGELYIDGRSSGNLFRLDNLINGHQMNNGTKFGRLHGIRNAEGPIYVFINEYTTGRTFIYQVFAARVVRAQDTGVHLNFSSAFVRQQYYQAQIDNSIISSVDIDFSSPILTLNTCDETIRDGHFLVFAVLIGWE